MCEVCKIEGEASRLHAPYRTQLYLLLCGCCGRPGLKAFLNLVPSAGSSVRKQQYFLRYSSDISVRCLPN